MGTFFNDHGELAFQLFFEDGTEGVFLARIRHHDLTEHLGDESHGAGLHW